MTGQSVKKADGAIYDLIILGGGPAGLTAALYAARKKLRLLLLTKEIGGQVVLTSEIENYMGYPLVTGSELMAKFDAQIRAFLSEDTLRYAAVTGLKRAGNGFLVESEQGVFQTRTVLIATGKRPRKLGVPGEESLRGRGVSYCATCDGPFFCGKDVAVVGGGNSALQAALELVKHAARVYLVDRSGYRAEPVVVDKVLREERIIRLHGRRARAIEGAQTVERFSLETQAGEAETLAVQGVFVEVGLEPNTGFLDPSFVALNERAEIAVDCRCRTNVPGVFAAGDVTDSVDKQIIIAAGDGAKAALAVGEYLMRA